jgi:malic enzyme
VEMTGQRVIRDITVKARDSQHGHDILDGLKAITGVRIANISDRTFLMHLGGKIEIDNVLCFPGFFRGLLDSRARIVNDEMKIAAAHAIASCVAKAELGPEYIIPSVFNKKVAPAVARDVARAAHKTGVARRRPHSDSPAWS